MKKLLKYLSPFAPDQSGACGVLYELGGLIVICDAGGCAGNICGFDEPRWFTKRSAVFSAGLRDMDAIMGRDDKLIEKLAKAQESLNGEFSAVVGTPVPAVIATDMKALKRMAEKKLNVPCLAIYCDGTKYYDVGEEEAWIQLFKEFVPKEPNTEGSDSISNKNNNSISESDPFDISKTDNIEKVRHNIGIIGATPLETGYADEKLLKDACAKYRIDSPIIFGICSDQNGLDEIRNVPYTCKKNLVVSPAGLKAAKYLEDNFNIPYEVAFPFIPDEVVTKANDIDIATSKVLIIHTQFAANELRNIMEKNAAGKLDNKIDSSFLNQADNIDCATFFMQADDYTKPGDFHLSGEDDLWEVAQSGKYDVVIADGDMENLFRAAGFEGTFINYSHFAISGNMNDNSVMFFD